MSAKTILLVFSFLFKLPRPRPTHPQAKATRPKESRTVWLTANGRTTILEVRR